MLRLSQRARATSIALLVGLVTSLAASLPLSGCGADDRLAPYTAPPPACPEADDYLQPLYQLEAEGRIANLAFAIRERIPDTARRDMIDALLRLLGSFEDGDFGALAADKAAPDDPAPAGDGLQVTLGRLLRWLAQSGPSAPNLPLLGVLRRALTTCEGAPLFSLLAEALADPALVDALLETLSSDALQDGLAGLDFEGEGGREALRYLVRNLLVSATAESFDVAAILDLLGLLVDLDAPPFRALADGVVRLLDADGLDRLQGLLLCVRRIDPELVLGGFLYDLLTADLLAGSDLGATPVTLSEPLRIIAEKALHALATDPIMRRGFSPALVALLADDVAPIVLVDLATLFEAEALSGVFDLVVDLASGACRAAPSPPP